MSQATLASMTSQGERSVRRQLDWLEKSGFLTRTKRVGARGRHLSDIVQLLGSPEKFLRAANLATAERRASGHARTCQRPNATQSSGQAMAADPSDLIPDQTTPISDRALHTEWPESLALTSEMREFAESRGMDAALEFEMWKDDCLAHGRRNADWQAAWRARILRRFAELARAPRRPLGSGNYQQRLREDERCTHGKCMPGAPCRYTRAGALGLQPPLAAGR